MPDDRISLRQLLALLFAALLGSGHRRAALPDRRPGRRGGVAVRPGCPAGTAGAVLGALCPPAPGRGGGGAGPGHRDRPGQGVGQGGTSSLFIVGSASAQRQRQAFRPPFPVHQLPERPPGSVFADPAGAHPLAGAQAGAGAGTDRRGVLPGPGHRPGLLPPPGRTPGGAPAHPSPVDGGSSGGALRRRSGAGPVRLCGLCRLPGGECHPGRGRPPPCAMVGGRLLSGAYRPSACLPWATSGPG